MPLIPLPRRLGQIQSDGEQRQKARWCVVLGIQRNPAGLIARYTGTTKGAGHRLGFAITTRRLNKQNTAGAQSSDNPGVERRPCQGVRRNDGNLHPLSEQVPDQFTSLKATVR